VTARLSLRERQHFVTVFMTGHSVQRYSQKLQTSKHGHIQYKYKYYARYARDHTMAAAGHAYGMARAAPGIMDHNYSKALL